MITLLFDVTTSDELNILAGLMAKKMGNKTHYCTC